MEVICSPWYQELWGDSVTIKRNVKSKLRFANTRNGHRIASSVAGGNTGDGGDFIVSDDPNNIKNVESTVTRDGINEWWDKVMSSRYMLLSQRRRLVIQQRSHTHDLSGHILAKEDPNWVHLCLPMEYEEPRCVTVPLPFTNGKKWQDPRKEKSELLWPEGINDGDLERIKRYDFGGSQLIIAGQLQQRPSPMEGFILQRDWFKLWPESELPEFEYILQSWDTALIGKETSAHSACTTWGVFRDSRDVPNVMLIGLYADQIEYPDLRKMMVRLARNYRDNALEDPLPPGMKRPVNLVLVENKASGTMLLRDILASTIPVSSFNPTRYGDKMARCRIISHVVENGRVWLTTQKRRPDVPTFESSMLLDAACLFPNPTQGSSTNDIIDSMSQALINLNENGWLYSMNDPMPMSDAEVRDRRKPFYDYDESYR